MIPQALVNVEGLRQLNCDKQRGVYFLIRASEVVYVGLSKNAVLRVQAHTNKDFDDVLFLPVKSGSLEDIERKFIELLRPKYNVKMCIVSRRSVAPPVVMPKLVSYRLTSKTMAYINLLAAHLGMNKTSVIAAAVLLLAKREKLNLKERN